MKRLFAMQPERPDRAIHGYLYYRWTERYMAVVRWALERPWLGPVRTLAARRLQRTHHAKAVPLADATRLITLDRPIEVRGDESVVPFAVARDIVLDAAPTLALARCACRVVAEERGDRDPGCGPVDTCLYVGDPVASFVVKRQPGARFVTREEALDVLREASERGNVHTLWFKDAAGGRMYAICNCCSCCCIGLKSQRAGFAPIAGSGLRAAVDADRCTACGACERACAFGAIGVRDGVAAVDDHACMGCGACEPRCPEHAISMLPATDGLRRVPLG